MLPPLKSSVGGVPSLYPLRLQTFSLFMTVLQKLDGQMQYADETELIVVLPEFDGWGGGPPS
jgi:hypothetical protein